MLSLGSQVSSAAVKPAQRTRYWTSCFRFLLPSSISTTKQPSAAISTAFACVASSGTEHDHGPALHWAVFSLQTHRAGSGNADEARSLHFEHSSHCAQVSTSSACEAAMRHTVSPSKRADECTHTQVW